MSNEIKYDVVIIGGGTSGCAAAYNCSLLGLKTLLVEKNNFLGGLMTGGLVVPVMKSSVQDINTDYYKKLVLTAKKFNAQITYKDGNDGWFNPEVLKIVLDEILTCDEIKKNLDILFETTLHDVEIINNKIAKLILKQSLLSIPVVATYYIDATGSGELSKLSGCHFINDSTILQLNSLRFILGNVNTNEFENFLNNLSDDEDITNTYRNDANTYNELNFTTASTSDELKGWKFDKYLKDGIKKGLLIDSDREYFQLFSIARSTSQVAFNCPRINNYKNNPYKSSLELINARKAIYRLYNFMKSEIKGFQNSVITNIATITGVREENRLKTKHIYSNEDILSGKKFNKPVLVANYNIDVHSKNNKNVTLQKVQTYELPIESLISEEICNLFCTGKIVGASFIAHSALRVQKSCMSMGEGVAKYIKSII